MITKPMLAGKAPADLSQLQYPLLATPKLDGIRCLVINGKAVSRTFKPIPNKFIRGWIEANCLDGFDGEILVKGRDFNQLSGDVRREDGEPDFEYYVFDWVFPSGAMVYAQRAAALEGLHERELMRQRRFGLWERARLVLPVEIPDVETLQEYESECIAKGYEGVMVRTPSSPYKCGRSTTSEGYLLKVKRFEDSEGTVIGFEEMMENQNVAEKDAFGRTKRSQHAENLVPKGTLGKLILQFGEHEVGVGTGYDQVTRDALWAVRNTLIGKIVKFKHQPSGAKEGGKPRFPTFLGFRDKWDL